MRVVTGGEIRAALSMTAAIDALEAAFRDERPSDAGPVRTVVETASGSLLLMPARGSRGVGVKLATVTPGNPAVGLPAIQASYVLFDAETQAPQTVFDGTALTTLRTGAVSGLATRWLARADATRLVVVGAGVQARIHVEAMRAVRGIEDVAVVARSPARAEELAAAAGARIGSIHDLALADVICTCTSSSEPVVAGATLAPGVHVNAVGAFTTSMRELDTEAIVRARVVVEDRGTALAEAGELAIAIDEGAIGSEHVVADLHEVVNGAVVRRDDDDLSVFKSVGMAFEDLVVASAVLVALG